MQSARSRAKRCPLRVALVARARAPAAPPRACPRPRREGAAAAKVRKRDRDYRDATSGVPFEVAEEEAGPAVTKKRTFAAASAELQPGIGETAAGRAGAFSPERRGAANAEHAVRYHVREAASHIEKLVENNKINEAAAVVGGLAPAAQAARQAAAPLRPRAALAFARTRRTTRR